MIDKIKVELVSTMKKYQHVNYTITNREHGVMVTGTICSGEQIDNKSIEEVLINFFNL
jgi:hypothetical protein